MYKITRNHRFPSLPCFTWGLEGHLGTLGTSTWQLVQGGSPVISELVGMKRPRQTNFRGYLLQNNIYFFSVRKKTTLKSLLQNIFLYIQQYVFLSFLLNWHLAKISLFSGSVNRQLLSCVVDKNCFITIRNGLPLAPDFC